MARRCIDIELSGNLITSSILTNLDDLPLNVRGYELYHERAVPSFITSYGYVVGDVNLQNYEYYSNDNIIRLAGERNGDEGSVVFTLYNNGGEYYTFTYFTLNVVYYTPTAWAGWVVDDEAQLGWVIRIVKMPSFLGDEYSVYCYGGDTITYNALHGAVPVLYQWSSVTAISGKNGILSLTQITDEAIGDGSQKMHQPYESILRFTDQSNIRQLIRNLPQNERRVIAYSGLNRLEVMWHDSSQYPNNAEYTLYFVNHYGEGNNQYYSTIYQIDGSLPYDGTEDKYLSMIIDRENEVAKYSEVTLIHDPTIPEYNNTVNYSYYSPSSSEMTALYLFIIGGDDEPQDEDDPYASGSTDGGGDGNPFQPQDHLGLNNKPTKSGLNLGFVTLYKPTETQLDDIARFMWSDDVLDNFKKYFNNFADNIISLMIIPYNLTSLPSKKFKIGNMESDTASLQSVEYVTDRYVDIDMGDFYIDRKWDSYLDCSPYTKLEIYLPYCGTHSLDTDEILYPANLDGFIPDEQGDPHLHINYRLDVATGNIVATLLVNDEIRYQFTGKCGMTVPLTGADYQNLVLGSITAGAGLAATIASGGATAPMTMSAAVTGTVMSQKPNNYRSGNMSGDISRLGYDTPYLIKTIPNLPEIKNQKSFTGYPSYRYGSIGAFSGFTQLIEAHIDNVSCTDAERDKIMAYLKEGVII
jgi:hypothetical protein